MIEALTDELAAYQARFEENRRIALEVCGSLTHDAFNWRPADGRWSVAECVEHLNISGQLFGEAIFAAAARGRDGGLTGTGPFRYGFMTRLVLNGVQPENTKRYRAPKMFKPRPASDYDPMRLLQTFGATGDRWTRCLASANGLDLARIRVASPATRLLRFNLGGLLAIQAAHERRHLEQARRVTGLEGFGA